MAVAKAFHPLIPDRVERAEGAIIWAGGRRYIDLIGGVGCLAVGHSHPKVVEAIQQQSALFTHTDYIVAPYEGFDLVCERLCALTPGDGPKKAALFNSGAEAVENAVKIARAYTGRPGIICFEGAFHGRTYMALSLTYKLRPYKKSFGPFMPEVYRIPYANPAYCYTDDPTREVEVALLRLLEQVDSTKIAALIVEPILGEGGIVIPPTDFLPMLRAVCDRYKLVLIVDEVQTGMGRTGRMWAIEHSSVIPDLMTVGKSLAAGLPLSAVVGRADILDAVEEGGLGGTYVGNPISCAAALAVFEIFQQEGLLERAAALERLWFARLARLRLAIARGRGAMLGVELLRTHAAPQLAAQLARRGVLMLPAGLQNNVLRALPPLNIPHDLMEEALDILVQEVAEQSSTPD